MINFPGTSVFAYGVRLHQPDPISHNVNRKALDDATGVKVAGIKDGLRNASVGVPAPSVDNLKASGLKVRGS